MDKEKETTNIKVLTNILKELAAFTDAQSATLSYCDSNGWYFSITATNMKVSKPIDSGRPTGRSNPHE